MEALEESKIDWWIDLALKEDLGAGDVTTDGIGGADSPARACVTAKEPLVICGLPLFRRVFEKLDPNVKFPGTTREDGEGLEPGETLIEVESTTATLLKGERTALNMLQRLSGIATMTRRYVEAAKPATILDTRKTTPGLRVFEKYAVRCGGGTNHRFGLFDAVLVKDNHIKAAGSITQAVQRIRDFLNGRKLDIEVETTNLEEVREALDAKADIIMLDNMTPDQIEEAVKLIDRNAKIEVSGSMNLDKIRQLARTGIDTISVGALTHSAGSVDISMNFV